MRPGRFEIEPLHVPKAAERLTQSCHGSVGGFVNHTVSQPRQGDMPEVAWFRWVTGHQLFFLEWRLLTEAMDGDFMLDTQSRDRLAYVESLIEVCSALYLYTGSCTSAGYLRLIRPAMMRCHPAFSGEWAVDYRRIPELIRRSIGSHGASSAARVRAAWHLNQRVHAAVAARLVPERTSLLQRAGRQAGAGPTAAEAGLFDGFFRVHRVPLCGQGFAAQLVHWLSKIITDLDRIGLYHDGPPVSEDLHGEFGERVAHLERMAAPMLTDQAATVESYLDRTTARRPR